MIIKYIKIILFSLCILVVLLINIDLNKDRNEISVNKNIEETNYNEIINNLRNEYNNESFIDFGNMLLERSIHNFNTTINENDIFLTLSTCYNENEKMVMHAKLIKKERRQ